MPHLSRHRSATKKPSPPPPRKDVQQDAEENRVKPVVPAEQSLVESHTESTLPDLKPVGE